MKTDSRLQEVWARGCLLASRNWLTGGSSSDTEHSMCTRSVFSIARPERLQDFTIQGAFYTPKGWELICLRVPGLQKTLNKTCVSDHPVTIPKIAQWLL